MKSFTQDYVIKAPLEKVWQAFVDPAIIKQWLGSSAKMDEQVGSKFELWDGDIHGINTEVVPNKKLVQDWYGGSWPEPSKVIFNLSEKEGITEIELVHENLPDDGASEFESGWRDYYMGPMKKLLEG